MHKSALETDGTLTVYVELVVIKIFSFSKHLLFNTDRLKEFCKCVDSENNRLLSYSEICWLLLMLAFEKIIKIYRSFKSFFLSEKNTPDFLQILLKYIYGQYTQILNIEKEIVTII